MVEKTCSSCWGPRFKSQHQHGGLQLQDQGNLHLLGPLWAPGRHPVHIFTHRQNAHAHKSKPFLKKKKYLPIYTYTHVHIHIIYTHAHNIFQVNVAWVPEKVVGVQGTLETPWGLEVSLTASLYNTVSPRWTFWPWLTSSRHPRIGGVHVVKPSKHKRCPHWDPLSPDHEGESDCGTLQPSKWASYLDRKRQSPTCRASIMAQSMRREGGV